jgi:hypothetical protein
MIDSSKLFRQTSLLQNNIRHDPRGDTSIEGKILVGDRAILNLMVAFTLSNKPATSCSQHTYQFSLEIGQSKQFPEFQSDQ